MAYCFDEIIDRGENSKAHSCKWEGYAKLFPGLDVSNTIPMWVADMDFRVADEILEAMDSRLKHGIFGYVSDAGVHAFAAACCDWLARRHAVSVKPEQMLFSPGVLCGLNAVIQAFTKLGDGVIIHTPVYYPFADGIKENGRVPVRNALRLVNGVYAIDFEELERFVKNPENTMMILSSPHNPGGRVWTKDELRRIAELCLENDVFLFSDEIHCDLVMPGHEHMSLLAAHDRIAEHAIVAYAPSKTFNLAGLCAALMVVPDENNRERLRAQLSRNKAPGANTFGLVAGEAAYVYGDRFADEVVRYIQKNAERFENILSDVPGTHCMRLEGTYLLWVDFNGTGCEEQDIYRTIVEHGGVAPDLGAWFGPGGEGFARFNIACPRSIVERAASQIRDAFLERNRRRMKCMLL